MESSSSSRPVLVAPTSESVEGKTPPPYYVRTNRISCDPCRKRKLKCDRVKPCTTCKRRGIEDECYQEGLDAKTDGSITKRLKLFPTNPSHPVAQIGGSRNGGADQQSSLASSLARCKEQLDAISALANQSTQSLDAVLSTLPNSGESVSALGAAAHTPVYTRVIGTRKDGLVTWQDVCSHLPSIEECEELITFYFEELSVYIRISQRSAFDRHWHLLLDGPGLDQTEAAIIFTAFALSSVMIPSSSLIRRHSKEDHFRWMTLLGDPASSFNARIVPAVDNSFAKIQLLGLTSVYHLYTGRSDLVWECVGIAVRKGIVFGLFDERSKSWAGIDNLQKEYRRRLAWYMLSLERWQAVIRQLPFALHPSYVHLAEASFEPDTRVLRSNRPAVIVPSTPTVLPDGRLQNHISARRPGAVKFVHVELLAWCQDYLDQFSTMTLEERYSRAILLDDAFERVLLEGLYNTGIERHELRYLSSAILDECVKERQVEVNLWVSSMFFLRCLITRRFLMDDRAPPNLRFVSLMYAQGILATIPSLTRIVKEGQTPVQTTWNANHLLAAATTFTVVILGQDHYLESQANPLELDTSFAKTNDSFPTEQMDWLADNIFTTLDCLETLIERGNHSAAVAKQLLKRLCCTQGDLRNLYKLRFERQSRHQRPPPPRNHQENAHQHREQSAPSRAEEKRADRSEQPAAAAELQSTPPSLWHTSPSNGSSGSVYLDTGHPDEQGMHLLQSMSASSLLDAVLMDPTELDFLGNHNHSDFLASLLQDSPPN